METIIGILKTHIDPLLQEKRQVVIAIDGNCTAGKTTLAEALAERYDCNVFHMDDFFLRPHQRTAERLAEPGGNVDYERFWTEVLQPLLKEEAFSYRPFSCRTLTLSAPVSVAPKKLNIVEGTYSLHPHFGEVYDLSVFLSISPEDQHRRILQRPQALHQRFFDMWIPMEQTYFDTFQIPEKCDICL